MTEISIIAAHDLQRGIGRGGKLPWKVPSDLARFERLTKAGIVIMGRKTWDSLPGHARPLRGRINVVVTRNRRWSSEGTLVAPSLPHALALVDGIAPIWVIGGQDIYQQAVPLATRLYLTIVQDTFGCDRFFPDINMDEWAVMKSRSPARGPGDIHAARYVDLIRKEEVEPIRAVCLGNVRERRHPFGVQHD